MIGVQTEECSNFKRDLARASRLRPRACTRVIILRILNCACKRAGVHLKVSIYPIVHILLNNHEPS